MFKLTIEDDEGKTTVIPLIRDEMTIGRQDGNTIRLTERNISRKHARLVRQNGTMYVEDLASYTGVRVNGARIVAMTPVAEGDEVQIGDYKLMVRIDRPVVAVNPDRATMPAMPATLGPMNSVGGSVAIPTRGTPAMVGQAVPGQARQSPVVPQEAARISQPAPVVRPSAPVPHGVSGVPDPLEAQPTIPVRTLAEVPGPQAATATSTNARLVVLTSELAGHEYSLARASVVIGRTEENDIVINHRSISRNHAKLVREPDNSRYTISDLQSSNGVRVNGSDYGKVELRRGDVIDLGHVRLRFVEAAEDFVFARDAVITDVPETGGRRGMVVALIAAIVVLVASVAVYTWRQATTNEASKHGATPAGTPGPTAGLAPDAEDTPVPDAAPGVPAAGSDEAPVKPPGEAAPGAATTPGAAGTAGTAATAGTAGTAGTVKNADAKAKAQQCAELEVNQKWQDLLDCSAELTALAAKDRSVTSKADEFKQKSMKETAASLASGKVKDAVVEGNLREAQKQLKTIGNDSVYFPAASETFHAAEARAIEDNRRKAQGLAAKADCANVKRLQAQLAATTTAGVVAAVAAVAAKCVDRTTAAPPPGPDAVHPPAAGANPDASAASQAKNLCETMNVDDVMSQAQNQYQAGFPKAALQLLTKALACRQDVRMFRMAGFYACAAHEAQAAKLYYGKVPPQYQGGIVQRCQQENITIP